MAEHAQRQAGQQKQWGGSRHRPVPVGGRGQHPAPRPSARLGADVAAKAEDTTGELPAHLVLARTRIASWPEPERRLFARELAGVVQRRTTRSDQITVQRQPTTLQSQATAVLAQLRALIAGADWPTIRRRVYPQQSAAGVARAKDRKAGKSADLTGLGKIASLERFAGAMTAIQADWATKSVADRLAAVAAAANAELVQAGVPKFLVVDKLVMTAKGSFTSSAWTFTINEDLVTSPTLDAATAAQLANAAMHESRHAEQHFLAARYSAGVNPTRASALATEQRIPPVIAREAIKQKLGTTSDPHVKALGAKMHQAFVTDKTKNYADADLLDAARDDMYAKKTKAELAEQALTAGVTQPAVSAAISACDALRAAVAEVERTYAVYRAVPFEADAHEVGDAAELAFKGWK